MTRSPAADSRSRSSKTWISAEQRLRGPLPIALFLRGRGRRFPTNDVCHFIRNAPVSGRRRLRKRALSCYWDRDDSVAGAGRASLAATRPRPAEGRIERSGDFLRVPVKTRMLAIFFVRAATGQFEFEHAAQIARPLVTMARNKLVSRMRPAGSSEPRCTAARPSGHVRSSVDRRRMPTPTGPPLQKGDAGLAAIPNLRKRP